MDHKFATKLNKNRSSGATHSYLANNVEKGISQELYAKFLTFHFGGDHA